MDRLTDEERCAVKLAIHEWAQLLLRDQEEHHRIVRESKRDWSEKIKEYDAFINAELDLLASATKKL